MRYKNPSKALFKHNRHNFSSQLLPHSLAIFHSNECYPRNADLFHSFIQESDFYYLSGIDQEESILLLAPNHPNENLREVLFIRKSDKTTITWEGPKLSENQASEISGICTVYNHDSFENVLRELILNTENIYLNFNEYPKFFSEVLDKNQRMAESYIKKFSTHQFKRSAPILRELRMIKSEEEITQIKKACHITGRSFDNLLRKLKPGMMEYQAQAEIEYMFSYNGSNRPAYDTIVAGGENACILHYVRNEDILNDGDLLLLDMGAEYGNYASDMSRTIPVNGKFSSRQKECYNAVLDVFKKAKDLLIPGNTLDDVNNQVKEWMNETCIKLGLYSNKDVKRHGNYSQLLAQYFMHGTSHHLGLNVHDVFDKNAPFKEGMVFTCEPGIYIKKEKIGIRIENDFLVTANGPVDLMEEIPIEIEEIEAIMNERK
ncbi:MAG: aminopeptidase P N-terminal domain-containing protein [Bacteroidales bacterium]